MTPGQGPPARTADEPAALKFLTAANGIDGHLDELLDETGALRPHWQAFVRHAGDLGARHLSRQQARVERQIHENGVTYNVYASSDGPARPWAVDVLPAIVPAAEWDTLADGLRQRARLLNSIAADVYGEQRLIAEGLLPPALVYGHRGFLRPCHGIKPPGGIFLHLVAFDVAHERLPVRPQRAGLVEQLVEVAVDPVRGGEELQDRRRVRSAGGWSLTGRHVRRSSVYGNSRCRTAGATIRRPGVWPSFAKRARRRLSAS